MGSESIFQTHSRDTPRKFDSDPIFPDPIFHCSVGGQSSPTPGARQAYRCGAEPGSSLALGRNQAQRLLVDTISRPDRHDLDHTARGCPVDDPKARNSEAAQPLQIALQRFAGFDVLRKTIQGRMDLPLDVRVKTAHELRDLIGNPEPLLRRRHARRSIRPATPRACTTGPCALSAHEAPREFPS